jgi:hypothetical protein
MPTVETSPLTIHVDSEAARAYQDACEQDRRKIKLLLDIELRKVVSPGPSRLLDVIERMGREAEANGMTPESLESIMNDGR